MTTIEEVLDRATDLMSADALQDGRMTDAEIKASAKQFSFDRDKFQQRLRIRSKGHKLLVAHLYLDHVVSAILAESMVVPAALDLERMAFAQKLQIGMALGLLRPEEKAMMKAVNDVRNRLAHRLDFEMNDEQVARIRSAPPSELSGWAIEQSGGRRLSLGNLLTAIVVFMEFRRQALKEGRLMSRRGEVHLAAAMLEAERFLKSRPGAKGAAA